MYDGKEMPVLNETEFVYQLVLPDGSVGTITKENLDAGKKMLWIEHESVPDMPGTMSKQRIRESKASSKKARRERYYGKDVTCK